MAQRKYEPTIGALFMIAGDKNKYKCEEADPVLSDISICMKCAFKLNGPCEQTACTSDQRKDKRDVYFTTEGK